MDSSSDVIRALAIGAHPDDIDFNAAGTIAKWVKDGVQVTYLIVTSGDAGGFGSVPREQIVSTRQQEQRNAGHAVGVEDVRFLDGYRDGYVTVTDDLVKDITRVIRDVRPHRVIAMSPERDWYRIHQGHSDHLASGEASTRAIYPASRNPFAFPELLADEHLEAWTVEELWLQAHPHPNHAEDITEEFELKVDAVRAHVSQLPHPETLADDLRARLQRSAVGMDVPSDRIVETFLKVSVK